MDTGIVDILSEPRIISQYEYKLYCKKYKIKKMKKIYYDNIAHYFNKSLYEMARDIYRFELENNIVDGLYF
jgi:histidinol phosphatase-like PHP family hydrolase